MDTLHAFLCLSIIMVVVHTGVGLTIDRINRACMKMDECVYEQHRAYICLKRWHRFFPCYSKQEPHRILKKVFIWQLVLYVIIVLSLITAAAIFFSNEPIFLMIDGVICLSIIAFQLYLRLAEEKAFRGWRMWDELQKTNKK